MKYDVVVVSYGITHADRHTQHADLVSLLSFLKKEKQASA
jgi:hypothetical protein